MSTENTCSSIVAETISELLADYHNSITEIGQESRLLVPGLTKKIAKSIHARLKDDNINSYLIIDDLEKASKEKRWLHCDAITSFRLGSMIINVEPGLLTGIQDSIYGAGAGKTVEKVFNDEWPWNDECLEGFDFELDFLTKLVRKWTSDDEVREWLTKVISKGLTPATISTTGRSEYLFDHLIDNFDPKELDGFNNIPEKFLYHVGAPYMHDDFRNTEFIDRVSHGLAKIKTKTSSVEVTRELLFERINEISKSDDERNILTLCIDKFYDGLGTSSLKLGGLLCFNQSIRYLDKLAEWKTLSYEKLIEIFSITEKKPRLEKLICGIKGTQGIFSDKENKYVSKVGDCISLGIDYDLGNYSQPASIEIKHRTRSVKEYSDLDKKGKLTHEIDTNDAIYKTSNKKIIFRINLKDVNDNIVKSATLDLHLCSDNRPDILIIREGFHVIDPIETKAWDGIEKSEIVSYKLNSPSYLYLFSNNGEPSIKIDDEVVDIGRNNKNYWCTSYALNPSDDICGKISVEAFFHQNSKLSIFNLETETSSSGEFTIEDELRESIIRNDWTKVRKILPFFSGTEKELYSGLGLAEKDKIRSTRAKKMELLGDELSALPTKISFTNNNNLSVFDQNTDLANVDQESKHLIKKYHESRNKLINTYCSHTAVKKDQLSFPIYAAIPTYIEKIEEEIEKNIIEYLDIYKEIILYIGAKDDLSWENKFTLIYLDNIVNVENKTYPWSLLGPWHPLVVSKRFMIQLGIFRCAKEMEKNKDKRNFSNIVSLLREIESQYWNIGLNDDNTYLEPAFVTTTSDQSWLFALKQDNASLINITTEVRKYLGIDLNIVRVGHKNTINSYIKSFITSFPNRRRINIRIKGGINASELINSLRELLYTETGVTEVGAKLTGGIQLFYEDEVDKLPEDGWKEPRILIYHSPDDEQCFEKHDIDILFIPPSHDISFSIYHEEEMKEHDIPRGKNYDSVFTTSLIWLEEAADNRKNSITYASSPLKNESSNSLASIYVSSIKTIEGVLKKIPVITRKVELPNELKCPWIIMPNDDIDPAIYIRYVIDGIDKGEERALWDFNVSHENPEDSYYTLCSIPSGFTNALSGNRILEHSDGNQIKEILKEIGQLGIAIGKEALQTNLKAHGVIGLIGAIRLITGKYGDGVTPLLNNVENFEAGIIIPVDSFQSLLGKQHLINDTYTRKRSDLLVIQLKIVGDENYKVEIKACAVECKFAKNEFNVNDVNSAIGQAEDTWSRFSQLIENSLQNEGAAERLALASLIKFGLRISQGHYGTFDKKSIILNKRILTAILRRDIIFKKDQKYNAILISSECELKETKYHQVRTCG